MEVGDRSLPGSPGLQGEARGWGGGGERGQKSSLEGRAPWTQWTKEAGFSCTGAQLQQDQVEARAGLGTTGPDTRISRRRATARGASQLGEAAREKEA